MTFVCLCLAYFKFLKKKKQPKNRVDPFDPEIPLVGHISREKHNLKRYIHSNVHWSQDMEYILHP